MHLDDSTLEAFINHELDAAGQREVDGHLAECSGCRNLAAELAEIRRMAAGLEAPTPPERVWEAIDSRVRHVRLQADDRPGPGPRRMSGGWRRHRIWLAAAAVVVMIAGATWYAGVGRRPPRDRTAADLALVDSELQAAEVHYQKAIEELQTIAARENGRLDPVMAEAITANLQAIDRAIGESRAALAAKPDDLQAKESLLEGFKSKLALLEDAVAAITESRSRG